MTSVSVIVPLLNEEDSLDELYGKLKSMAEHIDGDVEFVFVNDGSTDRSAEILDGFASQDSSVTALHLARNFGQTPAMMAGFDMASGEIIVSLDADLQNDPVDIPTLVKKLNEGFDVVSGWRRNRKDPFLSKVFVSRIANAIISMVSGVRIHDYGCSLKAYRASVLKDVRLYGEMHRFIPIYAKWQGARITEMEVTHHPRKHGTSNYGLERIFKVVMDLIVVKFLHGYDQKPMYIFGSAGVFCFLIALSAGALAVYRKIALGASFISTPLPLLVVMTFVTGVTCILMGLLAELIVRTYFEAQEKKTYSIGRISRSTAAPVDSAPSLKN